MFMNIICDPRDRGICDFMLQKVTSTYVFYNNALLCILLKYVLIDLYLKINVKLTCVPLPDPGGPRSTALTPFLKLPKLV